MKKTVLAISLGLSMIALSACSNDVVVQSGAGNITKAELEQSLIESNGGTVLEKLIEQKLLEANYSVPQKEIDNDFNNVKARFSSDKQFNDALTANGFKDQTAYKEQIKLSLLTKKAVTDGIKVTDQQLKDYFNQNKDKFITIEAQQILVKDKATAENLKKQLDNGADFTKLAKKYSIDTLSAKKGGNLGTVKKGQMVSQFDSVAFSMKPGTISDVVQSQYGYHIIKVNKKTEPTFEQAKSDVKEQYSLAHAKSYQQAITDLKKKDNVTITDPNLNNSVTNLLLKQQQQSQTQAQQ